MNQTASTIPDEREVDGEQVLKDRRSKTWVDLIEHADKHFKSYQNRCDEIDRHLGELEQLSAEGGRRKLQVFWANLEVLKPSIYSRPPIPIVIPTFKSRNPVKRKAAEVLERSLITQSSRNKMHNTMEGVRDDLLANARGVPWVRLETDRMQRLNATVDHVDRADFLHSPARKWTEVEWVARRSWLTRKQMKRRFAKTSDGAWLNASYKKQEIGTEGTDKDAAEQKAEVWELWHKVENVVVWISTTADHVLDARPPLYNLENFFPCPEPAYSNVQRRSLIPIPDYAFYRDQIQEVNELTARIAILTNALRVKGIYPAGATDVGEAVEKAFADNDDTRILIPLASMSQLGPGNKMLEWFPVGEVAQVIRELVELRRQMIDDIYQITGLSDIMRGATEASETATAQNLKAQYGSIRVRNRQEEMVRVALDVTEIVAEIMCEHFDLKTVKELSQVEDIPHRAEVEQQAAALQQQAAAAQQQAEPEQAQQIVAQIQEQLKELSETVTWEAVMDLFQAERTRPFILNIETDSTIQPDEQAEKEARTEFLSAVGGFAQQALPLAQAFPPAGPLIGEMIKFAAGGFRAGRELDAEIDELVEHIKEMSAAMAQQQNQEQQDPAAMEAQARIQQMGQELQAKLQGMQQEAQARSQTAAADQQRKTQEAEASAALAQQKAARELEQAERKMGEEIALKREQMALDAEMKREQMRLDHELAMERARLDAGIKRDIELDKARLAREVASDKMDLEEAKAEHQARVTEKKAERRPSNGASE